MSAQTLLYFLIIYFCVLYGVSYFIARKKENNRSFFSANKTSKWYVVALGMIGTTMSGITFISVPGKVSHDSSSYLVFAFGSAVGMLLVIAILLPLYYRLQLTSIYGYIGQRFGIPVQKIASSMFIIARVLGCAGRFYLILFTLQIFVFDDLGVPFFLTTCICLFFIWLYTFRGGLQTIIWTDLIQTIFLLSAVVLSFYYLMRALDIDFSQLFSTLHNSPKSQLFFSDNATEDTKHFAKLFFGGLGISLATVGVDQDIMQKNLSLPNLREARKDMYFFVVIFMIINICFVSIGILLNLYSARFGVAIPHNTDYLYPNVALHYLPLGAGIFFMMGLTAATFATTDAALTALTTSFCVDMLDFERREKSTSPKQLIAIRSGVHIGFSVLIFLICLVLFYFNREAMVATIFKIASYSYGPLLGLFAFGLITRHRQQFTRTLICCVSAPFLTYLIVHLLSVSSLYRFGHELIFLNAALTFLGLWVSRVRA